VARFVDEAPEFLYVPGGEVMRVAYETGAIPYDVPGVELGHHGDLCIVCAIHLTDKEGNAISVKAV